MFFDRVLGTFAWVAFGAFVWFAEMAGVIYSSEVLRAVGVFASVYLVYPIVRVLLHRRVAVAF